MTKKTNNSKPFTCEYCGKTTTSHYKSFSHYSFCSDCANEVLEKALIIKQKREEMFKEQYGKDWEKINPKLRALVIKGDLI